MVESECVALILLMTGAAPYLAHVYIELWIEPDSDSVISQTTETAMYLSARIPTIILSHFILNIEACRLWFVLCCSLNQHLL